MLLQTALFREFPSAGVALETSSSVFFKKVLLQFLFLLEPTLTLATLEEVHLVLFMF